jgi:hypothetical protein
MTGQTDSWLYMAPEAIQQEPYNEKVCASLLHTRSPSSVHDRSVLPQFELAKFRVQMGGAAFCAGESLPQNFVDFGYVSPNSLVQHMGIVLCVASRMLVIARQCTACCMLLSQNQVLTSSGSSVNTTVGIIWMVLLDVLYSLGPIQCQVCDFLHTGPQSPGH